MARDIKIPEKFQEYINSLIKEDAMILVNTKKSEKDEIEWLKGRIKEVRKKKTVYLMAQYNDKIIGACHIALERERKSHIGELGIAIKNGFRGIGLGKYLMGKIIKMAKTELKPKPKIIELEVFEGNKPAIALYKKMGFKQVARIPKHIQYKNKLISEIIMQLEV